MADSKPARKSKKVGIINSVAGKATAISGVALALTVATATSSQAASTYDYMFTAAHPSFSATDSSGTFDAQMRFVATASSLNPMPWSFRISPALQSIASGDMTCRAYRTQNGLPTGYSDTHIDIPVDYLWHSSVPNNPIDDSEILSGSCVFPVDDDGAVGVAVVTLRFSYVASDAGIDDGVNQKDAYSSSVSITH